MSTFPTNTCEHNNPPTRELGPAQDAVPHVDLEFRGETWKLLVDLPRAPTQGEVAVLRIYQVGSKKAVIDRDTDLLTTEEARQNQDKVNDADLD